MTSPQPLSPRPPCSWCTRREGHRPNCPRPDERYTADDLAEERESAYSHGYGDGLAATPPAPRAESGLRELSMAVVKYAEPDESFEGEYIDYLVPAAHIDALTAALRSPAATDERDGLLREAVRRAIEWLESGSGVVGVIAHLRSALSPDERQPEPTRCGDCGDEYHGPICRTAPDERQPARGLDRGEWFDAIKAHEAEMAKALGPNRAKRLAQPLYDRWWATSSEPARGEPE